MAVVGRGVVDEHIRPPKVMCEQAGSNVGGVTPDEGKQEIFLYPSRGLSRDKRVSPLRDLVEVEASAVATMVENPWRRCVDAARKADRKIGAVTDEALIWITPQKRVRSEAGEVVLLAQVGDDDDLSVFDT
jgi:hypothetical protein